MNTDMYMGWFGLSWEEKVAAAMYKILGSDYKSQMKKLMQPGGYNIQLVQSIYNGYVLAGFKMSTAREISDISGADIAIVNAFRTAITDLAIKGEIPYKYYDPETVNESKVIQKDYLTPEPVKKLDRYVKVGAALIGSIVILQFLKYLPKGKG
jgi:hypothetical protein